MNKKEIIQIINEVAKSPLRSDIEVLTRKQALEYNVDDDSFFFTNGDPVDYYIIYGGHPDYAFVKREMSPDQVRSVITEWFSELDLS